MGSKGVAGVGEADDEVDAAADAAGSALGSGSRGGALATGGFTSAGSPHERASEARMGASRRITTVFSSPGRRAATADLATSRNRVVVSRPMNLRSALFATALVLAACAGDTQDPKTPAGDTHKPTPEDAHARVMLTSKLLDDNKLTAEDVAQLQLFLRGRVVLRRETTAGAREITKQHTLKVVDGRSYDEIVIDSGTPGVSKATDELRVNFDPDDPDSGLVFTADDGGRFKLSVERKHGDPSFGTMYDDQRYEVIEGNGAYLELEEEKLHAYITHQRKLPGTRLPEPGGSAAPSGSAAPVGSAAPAAASSAAR